MRVIAFDPGPHVGVAIWTDAPESVNEWDEFESNPAHLFNCAEGWIVDADVVVCESFFIMGSRDRNSNQTIELIGVLRYLAFKHGKQFITQAPADAKSFSDNRKLKRIGWYKPAAADHARSATRHLLLYLVNARLIDPSRVL